MIEDGDQMSLEDAWPECKPGNIPAPRVSFDKGESKVIIFRY